ncbi:type IV conjugative transfer system coupling protein TraD [Shewanella sp. MBTL60-007]|uniref:type IV conjugative transfer system coupling protein TraD n=1 Tax=Shewanella sp. MBTL60-007 TaxID=2815911 RepID=UPI001BB9BF94|nr:type IV conjugative transfer system coupling protein TraD [Shewanella sp. MBTL60-007]GIU31254.1 conjugative coupling factor TraD, PFGI-1 class [Shewanella sp. MBTL60-007]
MSQGPNEALLRPPVELTTTAACVGAAIIMFNYPLLPQSVSLPFAGAFCLGGIYRAIQAKKLLDYHKHLNHAPVYQMASKDVPCSPKRRLLGRGFDWTPKHTQRIADLMTVEGRKYITPNKFKKWVRRFEEKYETTSWAQQIIALTRIDSSLNPVRPPSALMGQPHIHGVEMDECDISMSLDETNGHTLVPGTTRVGKTVFARYLISQDIARGDGPVIVWDPKGDAELMLRTATEAKRHGRTFYMLHLGYPDLSVRYNSLGSFQRVSEIATRVASGTPGEGNSAAFKEFTWRFVNIASQAMVNLGERPNYEKICEAISNLDPLFNRYCEYYLSSKAEYIGWQEEVYRIETNTKNIERKLEGRSKHTAALYLYIEKNQIFDQTLDGLVSAIRYSRSHYDKLTASALPLLEKLTSGRLQEILSPDYTDTEDNRPILSWEKVFRKNAVVYVGLDALSNNEVAKVFGNSSFSDFVSAAGYVYKHGIEAGLSDSTHLKMPTIYGHADEFSDLVGDEFQPLLNKAGGAGVRMTCYTQTEADIESGIGSAAKAQVLIGNFNNIIMFRVKSVQTAELLTSQLPETTVYRTTPSGNSSDMPTSDSIDEFRAMASDQVESITTPMITPDMVINLPKGHAFALVDGGKLKKIRIPYIHDPEEVSLSSSLLSMAEDMRKKYKTSESWWEKEAA